MLAVPASVACGIVVLSVHAALADWDLDGLSKAWLSWIEKGFQQPDVQEQRMEAALRKMMVQHLQQAIRYVAHFLVALVLFLLYRMQQQPDSVTVVQFVAVLVHYLCAWWVARSQLTFNMLRLITLLSHAGHTFFIVNTHTLFRGSGLPLALGCLGGLSRVRGCCHSRPASYDPMSGLGLCGGSCMLLRTGGETPRSSVAFPLWAGYHPGLGMRGLNHGPELVPSLHQSFIPVGRR